MSSSGFSGKRIACPKCREEGRDSTGNHLSVFNDGKAGWCTRFHGLVRLDGEEQVKEEYQPHPKRDDQHTIALVNSYPHREYEPRKISLQAMEFFDVRTEFSVEDGSAVAQYYPYQSDDGSIIGYKKRLLPKLFSSFGKIAGFFGWRKCQGDNFIIVVEGEQDALAGYDMMVKLKGKAYNIVSLPHGANDNGTLDSTTRKCLEWLSKFKKVVVCLDNDLPGKATANALADYLCSNTDVRITELPLKDTAAMWEAGREEEWAKAINNAKKYVSDQIVLGSDTPLDELMKPLVSGVKFSFLPKTSNKMHGFRTREMTTLIAPPKCGKSSMLRQMEYELLLAGEIVGGFFLEETIGKTKQSVIAMHSGVALNQFRANPKIANKQLVEDAHETLLPNLHLFTHKGKTITDDLLERKIDYMVKSLGCKTVILDHASFVTGTRDSNNERKDIDMMLTKLARMVEDEDFRLLIVAHIKRGAREQGRENPKVKYPYWEILSPDDARGSGAFEQLSHNLLGIERQRLDPEEENTRGLLRTRIMLNREWGVEGIGDYLSFGQDGKFQPVEAQYE